jgi:hypothetical protein
MSDFINAGIDLFTALASSPKTEPTRKIVDLLGMQDPPSKRYEPDEIEQLKLTCLGGKKTGNDLLAEWTTAEEVFTHSLTLGKTGIGKTTYFMSTYLFRYIAYYNEASVIIMDAMDGVIEEAIALCKKYKRKYIVLPDDEMNILDTGGTSHETADKLGQVYMQAYGSMEGDSSHYHKVIKNFIKLIIPLLAEVEGKFNLQEILSLASEEECLNELITDAKRLYPDSPNLREYNREFGKMRFQELRKDLNSLRLFIREITQGKLAYMLNQKNAPSLVDLINDPERPVIIMRVGDYAGSVKYTLGVLAVSMISNFVMNRDIHKSNHPCLFYIDEAGLMMNSSSSSAPQTLSSMLQLARKKRCGFVLGMQHINQVPDVYRSTFLEGCNTTILHPDLPHETAQYFADKIGNVIWEITYPSETRDADGRKRVQISSERKPDYFMSSDEIMNIAKDEVIVIKRHEGAKRTPMLLKKPKKLTLDNVEPYIEPQVPQYAPDTVWEERKKKNSSSASPGLSNQLSKARQKSQSNNSNTKGNNSNSTP